MKGKIMICQPMANRSEDAILEERCRITKLLENRGYEVLDTFIEEEEYSSDSLKDNGVENISLFYLSKSLEYMSKCDAVFFCKEWNNFRGCIIEHLAANSYKLKVLYENSTVNSMEVVVE